MYEVPRVVTSTETGSRVVVVRGREEAATGVSAEWVWSLRKMKKF